MATKKTETDTEQNKKTKGQAKLASQILNSYSFDMAYYGIKKDKYELKDVALKYIFIPGRQKEMKLDRLRR